MSNSLTAAVLILPLLLSGQAAFAQTCEKLFAIEHRFEAVTNDVKKPWFQQIRFASVEKTLRTGKIVSIKDLRSALADAGKRPEGTTVGLALVTFEDGTQAVWKPGVQNLKEVAAYRVAREVGSRLVPPTVERKLDRNSFGEKIPARLAEVLNDQVGSLQYFVKTSFDLASMRGSDREKLWALVPAGEKAERDIFNFVFGNWDLHWGNLLIDGSHSIVQIDNGVIGTRQMVHYGEVPFIRRMGTSAEFRKANEGVQPGPFPFDQAVLLNKPSTIELLTFFYGKVNPQNIANFIGTRLKNSGGERKPPPDLVEAFVGMVRENAEPKMLRAFIESHPEYEFTPNDFTMRVVFWENSIWIQAIGYHKYGAIVPAVFSKRVIEAYRKLTFERLRALFPAGLFDDPTLHEILSRRDQILKAAKDAETSGGPT